MEKLEIVKKLCEMPREFHILRNKSIVDLFLATGYMEIPDKISTPDLESYLRQYPEFIKDWQILSWDNHGTPAWNLDSHGDSSIYDSGRWIVGYSLGNKIFEFENAFQACAFYIKQFVEQIREHIPR